ncbi:single-pass membrane and coiled-coil domain-containing protein 4 isoform 1-T1 [Thomomys bottae]
MSAKRRDKEDAMPNWNRDERLGRQRKPIATITQKPITHLQPPGSRVGIAAEKGKRNINAMDTSGITQVSFIGNQCESAEFIEAAVLEEKEFPCFDREPCGACSKQALASRKDAAAQRQAQEGDIQRQERAEAGHAGGPAADYHSGLAHAGCGRASDCGVRLRGHTPCHH